MIFVVAAYGVVLGALLGALVAIWLVGDTALRESEAWRSLVRLAAETGNAKTPAEKDYEARRLAEATAWVKRWSDELTARGKTIDRLQRRLSYYRRKCSAQHRALRAIAPADPQTTEAP